MRISPLIRFVHDKLSRGVLAAILAALIAGCGTATYESRLSETVKYFEYIDQLDTNLQRPWRSSGIEIRVPKQFGKGMGPPQPEKDAEGNLIEVADNRQPDYLNLTLPGLVGAWKGRIAVNGKTDLMPCHLYVMSNYDLWADASTREAATEFHGHVVQALTSALQIQPPAESAWEQEKFPPTGGYVPSRAYTSLHITPEAAVLEDSKTTFALYLYKTGDIQVAILLVHPDGVADRERFPDRMQLALGTLNVSNKAPQASAPAAGGGEGGGTAPAGQPGRSSPQF